jgi:hypothetical protein
VLKALLKVLLVQLKINPLLAAKAAFNFAPMLAGAKPFIGAW